MRKFILLFSVCLCVLFANAQVRNSRGEKVVRRIDVYMPKDTLPYIMIDFNYSNSLKLEEVVFFAPKTGKVIWKRNGDELTRTEYYSDGKIRENLVYYYTITDDLITECIIENIETNGGVNRHCYSYFYSKNNRLITSDRRVFHNSVELSDRYREIFGWNEIGDVFTTNENGKQWKIGQNYSVPIKYKNRKYYEELDNDTNIDLPLIYENIGNFERFEMVTEWFGRHPVHLIEKNNNRYFDYIYDNEFGGDDLSDDRGNLIQMDVYNQYNRLDKIHKIYYWE